MVISTSAVIQTGTNFIALNIFKASRLHRCPIILSKLPVCFKNYEYSVTWYSMCNYERDGILMVVHMITPLGRGANVSEEPAVSRVD